MRRQGGQMKLVIAIIKPSRLEEVRQADDWARAWSRAVLARLELTV